MDRTQEWNDLAAQLGVDSIRCSTAAGSGHPTSSLSAAHLAAVLFSDHLRFDVEDPAKPFLTHRLVPAACSISDVQFEIRFNCVTGTVLTSPGWMTRNRLPSEETS